MGCEHECINEHRLQELESAVHEMKEKHSKRDEGFFNRINALEQKIALYNNDLGHIKDTVDEMNDNLKALMEKPGKLQDKIIAYVITGIIGIVLGFPEIGQNEAATIPISLIINDYKGLDTKVVTTSEL